MNKDDSVFKNLAKGYLDVYGEKLRENYKEQKSNPIHIFTPKIDKTVKDILNRKKRNNILRNLVVAASIVLMVAIPLSVSRLALGKKEQGNYVDVADTEISDSMIEENAPLANSELSNETILLSFELPKEFSVKAIKQDYEKSMYYLDDENMDDVVMSLEYSSDLGDVNSLSKIDINGYITYATTEENYNYMTFIKEDIKYILTCKYDINTLIKISEKILI